MIVLKEWRSSRRIGCLMPAADQIDVLIHPQSVRGFIPWFRYVDGSHRPVVILICVHRLPMRGFLSDRIDAGVPPLDLTAIATLQFEKPDMQRFRCSWLFDCLRAGDDRSAVLNAANASGNGCVSTAGFVSTRFPIWWMQHCSVWHPSHLQSLEQVLAIDAQAAVLPPTKLGVWQAFVRNSLYPALFSPDRRACNYCRRCFPFLSFSAFWFALSLGPLLDGSTFQRQGASFLDWLWQTAMAESAWRRCYRMVIAATAGRLSKMLDERKARSSIMNWIGPSTGSWSGSAC